MHTMSKNAQVAAMLSLIADLLEGKDENRFKIRAYRTAAQTIETLDEDIAKVHAEGKLRNVPAVGEAIAEKISQYLDTGKLDYLEKLKKDAPTDFEQFVQIEGLGPKRVMALYQKLRINTLRELQDAAMAGKIRTLEGFGEKSEQKILDKLGQVQSPQRTPYAKAKQQADTLVTVLRKQKEVTRAEIAGSIRRHQQTIGDLDILAVSKNPEKTASFFSALSDVQSIITQGPTKVSVRLKSGMQADLRLVKPEEFGAAWLYFTGSKAHNIELRKIAQNRGWKLNEYGLLDQNSRTIAQKTEDRIYQALGIRFIPAEEREQKDIIQKYEMSKETKTKNKNGLVKKLKSA